MADDLEKTEDAHLYLNKKGTCPFFYAKRYVAKEIFYKNLVASSVEV